MVYYACALPELSYVRLRALLKSFCLQCITLKHAFRSYWCKVRQKEITGFLLRTDLKYYVVLTNMGDYLVILFTVRLGS